MNKTAIVITSIAAVGGLIYYIKGAATLRRSTASEAVVEIGGKEYVIPTGQGLVIRNVNIEYRGDFNVYVNGKKEGRNFFVSPI